MTAENKPIDWVEYKPRELKITCKKRPLFDDFMKLVLGMDQEIESSGFWRGDLYNHGLEWFDEELIDQLFGPETSWKTWQNNASVCGRVHSSRRREGPHATYSHHAEIAYLDPEDFEDSENEDVRSLTAEGLQSYYLQMSIENFYTISDLRSQIKSDKGIMPDLIGAMEKIASKIESVTEELPFGWDTESAHLEGAYHQVELAIESGRNRIAGMSGKIELVS
jgi:hypothetical protein